MRFLTKTTVLEFYSYDDGPYDCMEFQLRKTQAPHRLNNKPAEVYNCGSFIYRVNGNIHREDGPAHRYVDEYGIRIDYWIDNQKLSEEEFLKWKKQNVFLDQE